MIQCVGSRIGVASYCSRLLLLGSDQERPEAQGGRPEPGGHPSSTATSGPSASRKTTTGRPRANVRFVRYDEERKAEVRAEGDHIAVSVFDPILNEQVELRADLLALSVGTVPNPGNADVGKIAQGAHVTRTVSSRAHVNWRPSISPRMASHVRDGRMPRSSARNRSPRPTAAVSRACTILTKDFNRGRKGRHPASIRTLHGLPASAS